TENGSTALLFAARFGHIDVVKVLLSNHADPTITNENGETALDWAVKTGNTEIADLLRAAEATRVTAATVEPS
ncbi:ankyrin repeat domain-containing protein, partial [Propionivibrio sp.]